MSARASEVRQTDVLDGYVRVLARAGYGGTTAEAVAAELDMDAGVVRRAVGEGDNLLHAVAAHVRDTYGRAIRASIADRPPDDRLEAILDLIMLDNAPFTDGGYAAAIAELAAAAGRSPAAASALREIYAEFELILDSELAVLVPRADPTQRRHVAFTILALAYAAPDFVVMGFAPDRIAGLRAAAARLIATLR